MALERMHGFATTVGVSPGSERTDADGLHIRGRIFTDRVESSSGALHGENRVGLDLDVSPDGGGVLAGTFELTLGDGTGSWRGELAGRLEGGLVAAEGLARGTGGRAGGVVHIEFRQVKEHPATPPVT